MLRLVTNPGLGVSLCLLLAIFFGIVSWMLNRKGHCLEIKNTKETVMDKANQNIKSAYDTLRNVAASICGNALTA